MLSETLRRASALRAGSGSPKNFAAPLRVSVAIRASRSAILALRIFGSGRCAPPKARTADTSLGLRGLLRGTPPKLETVGDASKRNCSPRHPAASSGAMVSLSDSQLQTVLDVAATIAPDRRSVYLERVGSMLRLRGRFSDDDVRKVVALAACGLIQDAHSAA